MNDSDVHIPPWALPLAVLAIAVPIIAAFALGGPGLGLMVGALVGAIVVVAAARLVPRGPIAPKAGDGRRRILLVAAVPLDDPEPVRRIVAEVEDAEEGRPEVRVLAPARSGFLDRWASDLGPARDRAQRDLVISLANLGKAEVEADARVGDEGLVQAVEDQLADYPATEVVLATGDPASDATGARAAEELGDRLSVPFHHVVVRPGA